MKVNVLGTEYEIITDVQEEDDVRLERMGADGYCDFTTKKIVIGDMSPDDYTFEDMKIYEKKVIRHELVHAFLHESGLDTSSGWARDETIVDWIALQFSKMGKIFEELEV